MGRNNILGSWGESVAAAYLKHKHYKLVAMNYSCRFGEIDLIVRGSTYLVFVEVKLRKSDRFACAAEHVDKYKQIRIRTTAELYLNENPTQLQPRFDIIEVYAPQGIDTIHPKINHLEDAF